MSNYVFGELTTAQRTANKLALRVIILDTNLNRYFVGDGVTYGGLPMSLKALVAAISTGSLPADGAIGGLTIATNPPADGTIAALTFSATPTQAEVEALRDECENLRDALAASNTTLLALRDECEKLRDTLADAVTKFNNSVPS